MNTKPFIIYQHEDRRRVVQTFTPTGESATIYFERLWKTIDNERHAKESA